MNSMGDDLETTYRNYNSLFGAWRAFWNQASPGILGPHDGVGTMMRLNFRGNEVIDPGLILSQQGILRETSPCL